MKKIDKPTNEVSAVRTLRYVCTPDLVNDVKQIIGEAQRFAYNAVNVALVQRNWLLGKRIAEEELKGEDRAEYGAAVIKNLSTELTAEYGKGFSERNLWKYKQFYLMFKNLPIVPTVSALSDAQKLPTVSAQFQQLSWSHYERLMRVANEEERNWYLKETIEQMWSYRTLDRNISTLYYRRLLSSSDKTPVTDEMRKKTADFQNNKFDFIKNPSVLEFLGLPANKVYTETALEQAIINQMQSFLLELGKGFSFVARQQLIRTDTQNFFIDLVFYNYILKCFVIVELKNHALTHQDIGQLDMYVRMYDDLKKRTDDNPTIGILLCTETDKTIARYSVLNENKQLFASKYIDYLPTEKELEEEIERQRMLFDLQAHHYELED
ncbi:MAG: PDDEXK nuclease domain-containing protein [Bacteroidales bacterium]|nr:PDDEXK nuclease domain-containing protein [Bacteroidales bacterium]